MQHRPSITDYGKIFKATTESIFQKFELNSGVVLHMFNHENKKWKKNTENILYHI